MSRTINRRAFLKLATMLPFGGLVLGKSNPLPSKRDYVSAELQEVSDYSTQSAPFVRYKGIWFFADENVIKWCPEKKLLWDNWDAIYINDRPDTFDFWSKIEGSLYWVGEHERWEVLVNPDDIMPVRICLSGSWDGENWTDY